jgi:SAM-dependent methyltransferase
MKDDARRDDGIQFLSDPAQLAGFENIYLKVRTKEGRLLDDKTVAELPFFTHAQSPYFKEWKARSFTYKRLQQYFATLQKPIRLMDLGCGNGWTAAGLAQNNALQVDAVDINLEELQQGARVFHRENLRFYYGNIFEDIFPAASFDVILLNGCAQYFEDFPALVRRLLHFLVPSGEIHIVDTPIYAAADIPRARARTLQYYTSLGFAEMARAYHPISVDDLAVFPFENLRKSSLLHKLSAKISGDVPANFQWIRIRKTMPHP